MKRFSYEQLVKLCDFLIIDSAKDPNITQSKELIKMGMFTELLRILIDNEWANQALFSMHHKKPKITNEAREHFKTEESGYEWMERIRFFAESAYNLQCIEGISEVIENIKNGKMYAGSAELEVGKHLYSRKVPFRYVKPTGTKRRDFDVLIQTQPPIYCEVKHKVKVDDFKEKGLYRTFSQAVDQLPIQRPLLLGVTIPDKWTEKGDIIDKVTQKFFLRHKEVVGILYRWLRNEHEGLFTRRYRLSRNLHSIYLNSAINEILDRISGRPNNDEWVSIHSLVDKRFKHILGTSRI